MRITNIFILCLLVISFLAGFSIFYMLRYHSFTLLDQTELEILQEENSRLINGIEALLEKNAATTKDWAKWDDTYLFMTNRNAHYIASNFTQEMIQDMEALGMVFLTKGFDEHFSYHLEGKDKEFKQIIHTMIAKKGLLAKMLAQGRHLAVLYEPSMDLFFTVVIYGTTPTETSADKPEVNGYIATVTVLDKTFLKNFSQNVRHKLELDYQPNKQDAPCSVTSHDGRFCNRVYFLNQKKAKLNIDLVDAENTHTLSIHTVMDRSFHLQIEQVFRHAMTVILIISCIASIIILVLTHFLVVRPTGYLARRFSHIAQEKVLDERLQLSGPKEIREMTNAANLMLEEISHLHQKLEDLSNTDGLTQLSNRRFFQEMFDREVHRAFREQQPVALLMFDIDFFKQYNDNYGHVAGDSCLQQVAAILKKSAQRATDIAARYGGEEFILLLGNTSATALQGIAEDIGANIREAHIVHASSPVAGYVTCSIGALSVIPNNADCGTDILKRVDSLLYQAKERGRNQIVLSDTLNQV